MIKWLALISAFACPLLVSGCHPWFETRWPWEKKPDPNVVITNSAGQIYNPGTPSWVPLIDDCMNAGGTRSECIATLPPEELAKLEAWEAQVGAMRREQMARRQVLSSSTE